MKTFIKNKGVIFQSHFPVLDGSAGNVEVFSFGERFTFVSVSEVFVHPPDGVLKVLNGVLLVYLTHGLKGVFDSSVDGVGLFRVGLHESLGLSSGVG